jgi:hypothetical protein
MSRQLTEIEVRKRQIIAFERKAVRARYAAMADAELNVLIPQLESDFDSSVQRGELPELPAGLRQRVA